MSKRKKKPVVDPPKAIEMGRPPIEIDLAKLKGLMRLNPTLSDTAAFFECSERTIERVIKDTHQLTFVEFRRNHMVHTRLNLIRKAVTKAEGGDNHMLKFCLTNLADWSDKPTAVVNVTNTNSNVNATPEQIEIWMQMQSETKARK